MSIAVFDNFDSLIESVTIESDKIDKYSKLLLKIEDIHIDKISIEDDNNILTNLITEANSIDKDNQFIYSGVESESNDKGVLDKIKKFILKVWEWIKKGLRKLKDLVISIYSTIKELIKKMLGQTAAIQDKINKFKIKYPDLYKKFVKLNGMNELSKEFLSIYLLSNSDSGNVVNISKSLTGLAIRIAAMAKMMESSYPALEYGKNLIKEQSLDYNAYNKVIEVLGNSLGKVIEENVRELLGVEYIRKLARANKENYVASKSFYIFPVGIANNKIHYIHIRKEPTNRDEVYYMEHELDPYVLDSFEDKEEISIEDLDKILYYLERDNKLISTALENLEKAQKRTTDRLEVLIESANDKLNNRTILEPFPNLCRDIVAYINNTIPPLIGKEYAVIVGYSGKVLGDTVKLVTIVYNRLLEELKERKS